MVDVVNISVADTSAGNNASVSGTSILGSGLLSTADDSFRNTWGLLAKWWSDIGAVNTVAGTGDAITVTTPTIYTALKTGMLFRFVASAANTTAVTLNLDALGAKAVRKISGGTDVALVAGDLAAGETYTVIYRASANSAAGAWVLVGFTIVPAATTSTAGIVQLATQTEAATLTDTAKAVTSNDLTFLGGYTTTATAAGTTTLTVTSNYNQYFTGTSTQTVVLPVTSTLVLGRSFRIVNNSTGAVTVQSSGANNIVVLPAGTGATVTCILTSGTTAASWDYRPIGPVLGTPVASTSGTSIDFTGIPAWAKRVTVNFNGVSTNGTSEIIMQIGDAGGIESTSTYNGAGVITTAGTPTSFNYSTSFRTGSGNAANTLYGSAVLTLVDAATATWACLMGMGLSNTATTINGGGTKALSPGPLDRVRITTAGGTDTFDAGSINIMWE